MTLVWILTSWRGWDGRTIWLKNWKRSPRTHTTVVCGKSLSYVESFSAMIQSSAMMVLQQGKSYWLLQCMSLSPPLPSFLYGVSLFTVRYYFPQMYSFKTVIKLSLRNSCSPQIIWLVFIFYRNNFRYYWKCHGLIITQNK